MVSDRSRILRKNLIVIALSILLYTSSECLTTKKLIIFIHGSLGAGLIFLNPRRALSDTFAETSYYIQMVKTIRESPLLLQDQVMLGLGLHEIYASYINSFHANTLDSDDCKKAAHYVIGAFDSCMQQSNFKGDCSYYTFGHYGLLSQKYRKEVAFELYHALCNEQRRYQQEYDTVEIYLIAHSHGGNIALNLYEAESFYKEGLIISMLFLLGMPIQYETAPYAYTDFFKRVINCYSDGDYVQGKDWVSTKYRRSYKTFKKFGYLHNEQVIDVRLLVNNKRKRVGHANMWLMGKARQACDMLVHLPLVVLVPYIMELCSKKKRGSHYDCHIFEKNNSLSMGLTAYQHSYVEIIGINNVGYMTERIASWHSDDISRHPFFNKKLLEIVKNLFKVWM